MDAMSLFAGIGGFDLALERAGVNIVAQAENDQDSSNILNRHFPQVRNYGDILNVRKSGSEAIDLVCGGFPCQDLSMAGKRAGLAGKRSGLWYQFHRVIKEFRPRWVVIENVAGLLSSNRGRDMGTILGTLAKFGYGYAYTVLNSQNFGVPQFRERVFIIGNNRNWHYPAKVLFEKENGGGGFVSDSEEKKANSIYSIRRANTSGNGWGIKKEISPTLDTNGGCIVAVPRNGANEARYLTPLECERLQGFPDGWTNGQKDTIRYRQLGDAVTVSVAEWIIKRILEVERNE